ncbi:hypothetical protein N7535_005478 [Penicillium sp. DV-2018c]|nr:hypothetical protein N7461_009052 [Penicillium sp. DV-2018c]KAJ5571818.1 hypothetical protein N7535_005478 [Penicillium sp. DV-2018c]
MDDVIAIVQEHDLGLPLVVEPDLAVAVEEAVVITAEIVVEKLTKNVTENHIREIFGGFGEIEYLDLPVNKAFMTNRGTAYILYYDPADAEAAIAHMHEAQLDGAILNLEGAVAVPDMVADPMRARHLHPDDMAVVALQNDMTSTDPSPRPDHDPQFALDHTHPHLGPRHRAEVVPTGTHGLTGAEARVTAATVIAVEVAVRTAIEAVIDIKHRLFCSPIT